MQSPCYMICPNPATRERKLHSSFFLFKGKLYSCTDSSKQTAAECRWVWPFPVSPIDWPLTLRASYWKCSSAMFSLCSPSTEGTTLHTRMVRSTSPWYSPGAGRTASLTSTTSWLLWWHSSLSQPLRAGQSECFLDRCNTSNVLIHFKRENSNAEHSLSHSKY